MGSDLRMSTAPRVITGKLSSKKLPPLNFLLLVLKRRHLLWARMTRLLLRRAAIWFLGLKISQKVSKCPRLLYLDYST